MMFFFNVFFIVCRVQGYDVHFVEARRVWLEFV